MKTVFTDTSHVAHLWANQLQYEAKNTGHNFYFTDKTIYSYGSHFPIARHVVNNEGKKAVLFTERTYSHTTSKHIQIVRQSANHLNIIYCYNPHSTDQENFISWQRECESIGTKLLKAKKPEIYLSQIANVKERATKYAEFFGLQIPESLQAAINISNKSQFAEYKDKKEQFEKAEAIRKQKELEKQHKKELKKWLEGKLHRLYVRNGFDYLRISDNRIETTQAVQIPMELGKRLYKQIKNNTLQIGSKVLDYEVTEVGENIRIGCHNFKTDYLLKFGQSVFN